MDLFQKKAGLLALGFIFLLCLFMLPLLFSPAQPAALSEGVALPVVMYHHVLDESSSLLGDYVISRRELEEDLLWLQRAGYTTVSPSQLVAYAQNKGELPEKPVLLTFDDGYESFYANVYPLLQKHRMQAVVSVIGRYSDLYSQPDAVRHLNYSHLTWEQIRDLSASPWVEIGNHCYDMHDASGRESRMGAKALPGESKEHYGQFFSQDTEKNHRLIAQAIGADPILYAYPFGIYTDASESLLEQMGYPITLSCESRISSITHDPSSLRLLGRFNRPHGISSQDFFARMNLSGQ